LSQIQIWLHNTALNLKKDEQKHKEFGNFDLLAVRETDAHNEEVFHLVADEKEHGPGDLYVWYSGEGTNYKTRKLAAFRFLCELRESIFNEDEDEDEDEEDE
jgi:hypothetical protein